MPSSSEDGVDLASYMLGDMRTIQVGPSLHSLAFKEGYVIGLEGSSGRIRIFKLWVHV